MYSLPQQRAASKAAAAEEEELERSVSLTSSTAVTARTNQQHDTHVRNTIVTTTIVYRHFITSTNSTIFSTSDTSILDSPLLFTASIAAAAAATSSSSTPTTTTSTTPTPTTTTTATP